MSLYLPSEVFLYMSGTQYELRSFATFAVVQLGMSMSTTSQPASGAEVNQLDVLGSLCSFVVVRRTEGVRSEDGVFYTQWDPVACSEDAR